MIMQSHHRNNILASLEMYETDDCTQQDMVARTGQINIKSFSLLCKEKGLRKDEKEALYNLEYHQDGTDVTEANSWSYT